MDVKKYLYQVKQRVDPNEWEKLKSTSEMIARASVVMAVDVPALIQMVEECMGYFDDLLDGCDCLRDPDPDADYICFPCRMKNLVPGENN